MRLDLVVMIGSVVLAGCVGEITGGADGAGAPPDAGGRADGNAADGGGPGADAGERPDASVAGPDASAPFDGGTVQITPSVTYQTMDGIGAALGTSFWTLGQSTVTSVLNDIDLHYFRLATEGYGSFGYYIMGFDTTAQGTEGGTLPGNPFITSRDVPLVGFLGGRNITATMGIWDVPAWVTSNVTAGLPVNAPNLGTFLATYYSYIQAQDQAAGGTSAYSVVEVQNEPNGTAALNYPTPADLVTAAKAVITGLDANPATTGMMLHGPNLNSPNNVGTMNGTPGWADTWCADSTLLARTEAISYHTWWVDTEPAYDAIWASAQKCGKPVWATEIGFCAVNGNPGCVVNGVVHPFDMSSYLTAFDGASSMYRAIAWSHATRTYYWELYGWNSALVSTTPDASGSFCTSSNPNYCALKQFANFIPPGAVYLGSKSSDSAILTLAFKLPDGNYSLILLNNDTNSQTVMLSVEGSAAASISQFIQTEDQSGNGSWYQMMTPNDMIVTLPVQSISSLVLTP
jgi:hypothetical protein